MLVLIFYYRNGKIYMIMIIFIVNIILNKLFNVFIFYSFIEWQYG